MSFYQVLGRGVRVIGWQVALVTDFRNPGFLGCWNHAVKSPLIGKKPWEIIPFHARKPHRNRPVRSFLPHLSVILGRFAGAWDTQLGVLNSSVPFSFLRDWGLLDRHSWTRNESDLNLATIRFFCGFFFSIFCVRWHLPFPKKNRKKHLTHPRTTWQVRF